MGLILQISAGVNLVRMEYGGTNRSLVCFQVFRSIVPSSYDSFSALRFVKILYLT